MGTDPHLSLDSVFINLPAMASKESCDTKITESLCTKVHQFNIANPFRSECLPCPHSMHHDPTGFTHLAISCLSPSKAHGGTGFLFCSLLYPQHNSRHSTLV